MRRKFAPTLPPCLANNFYGIFGQQSLLPISVDEGSVVPLFLPDDGPQQLFWIQESAIDNSLRTPDVSHTPTGKPSCLKAGSLPQLLSSIALRTPVLSQSLTRRAAHILSTRLPRFWKALPIPAQTCVTAIERVRDILVSLRFDALVAGIVNGISVDHMQKDIRYLTNEDGTSGIASRHSFHHGSRIAAKWLKTQFEDAGAACRFMPFLEGFAPNIICRYDAKTESSDTVLISGHYDSRGSFGLERAPGGNDDGPNVELVVFAGEEQGLLGSKAICQGTYVREVQTSVLMIQADMLAYHVPDEPPQLGLAQFLSPTFSAIYSPELTVGFTVVCCSDHQVRHLSFSRYPATHLFERTGPNPGYDLNQVRSICKVQFATLLHAAGFDLPRVSFRGFGGT
ncbi:hypothetical protein EDC04DRAFT_2866839 [Pisolithus marmoratus]|nr:hypothetical protein EDC04DRAFT_2866839 [Pisolithus marmoratus]